MSDSLVIGLDVGGTSTRAAVYTLTGDRLGTGRAGGGNPTSHGAERAAAELRTALTQALAGVDPVHVRAGVIGLAGAGRLLADPVGRAAFDQAWRDAGLRCAYAVHGDALVAYASGTDAPDGTILIAGTGAIAAQVRDRTLGRTSDGHGWLLGDLGSGFWLGREAVRHLLTELDRGRQPSTLGSRVLAELLGTPTASARLRQTAEAVVQTVTRRPPIELARLAPIVITAADEGEPAAVALVTRAAHELAVSTSRIRPAESTEPLVLGGGLLTALTPLAAAVRAELAVRWPDAPLRTAGDGAAAAAWLAACSLLELDDPADLHRRLFPPTD